MAEEQEVSGPDLKRGVGLSDLVENEPLLGHVDEEAVLLVRRGDQVFAVAATCTHYGGPLAEGLVVGDTIRCPWHHARFNMRTGEAEGAPALNPISCFQTRRDGDRVTVTGKTERKPAASRSRQKPASVVIVGAGAAGAACADMLRMKGYGGTITMIAEEDPSPVDRPNLSKDYLAGTAPEEWIPLPTPDYYKSIGVDLVKGTALRIRTDEHEVELLDGPKFRYDALLLATGAEPRSLSIEGVNLPHVHRLRTLADSKAIIGGALKARSCVVIGSSFIGLEVAASLRARGLEVTVVGQDSIPLANVLGPELGHFIQRHHERHGVRFLLEAKPQAIYSDHVALDKGRTVAADLVVLGVGVAPRTALAEEAGVKVDGGVVVDEMLRTSAPDVYAAGDIARYPEFVSGQAARIEHWVVAERQGQAVARAILGIGGAFREAPFFWSQHYDVQISYLGRASGNDSREIDGDFEKGSAAVTYRREGRVVAVATIGRDRFSLEAEAAMEAGAGGS